MASLQTTLKQDHIFNRLAVASTPVMGLCLLVGCWAGHQRVDGEQRSIEHEMAVQRACEVA